MTCSDCGSKLEVVKTAVMGDVTHRHRRCACGSQFLTVEKVARRLPGVTGNHRQPLPNPPPTAPQRSEQLSSLNLISDLSLPESDPSKSLDLVKPPAREPETVRLFEVIGGAAWGLPKALHEQWRKAYPAVDVATEYEKIAAWLASNPANRKTPRGMSAFVNRWLGRAQDRARPTAITRAPSFRTTQEIQTDAARRFLDRHPEEAAK